MYKWKEPEALAAKCGDRFSRRPIDTFQISGFYTGSMSEKTSHLVVALVIGLVVGGLLGMAMGDVILGLPIGVVFGIVFGAASPQK